MNPISFWTYVKVEVTTDGGLVGQFWLAKLHSLPGLPPVGYELDYRGTLKQTVALDKVLIDPNSGVLQTYQSGWVSMTLGDLAAWQHAGWQKLEMSEEELKGD